MYSYFIYREEVSDVENYSLDWELSKHADEAEEAKKAELFYTKITIDKGAKEMDLKRDIIAKTI